MRFLFLTFLLTSFACTTTSAQRGSKPVTMTFPAADSLMITADVYESGRGMPWIVLCHQAGFSRGEYKETAPKFVAMGFNVLVPDLRSGKEANGVTNETAARAAEQGLGTSYADAEQDMVAAIAFTQGIVSSEYVVLLGSSYSAALACKVGKTNPLVTHVVAFSPGEYVKGQKIGEAVAGINKPIFITSSKDEIKDVEKLAAGIDAGNLVHFKPSGKGIHGSRALWDSTDNNEEYWEALNIFLSPLLEED